MSLSKINAGTDTDTGCCDNINLCIQNDQEPNKINLQPQKLLECNKLFKQAATQNDIKASKSDGGGNDSDNGAPIIISDLIYDCLAEVLKYLELRDQVSLAQTCTSLRHCFVDYNKFRFRQLDLEEIEDLDLWQKKEFFSLLGQFVTHIEGFPYASSDIRFKVSLNFIAKFCKNVANLQFSHDLVSTRHLNKLFSGIINIVELSLSRCKLTDNAVAALRKLHRLKRLDLSNNFKITGKYISTLSNSIEILDLNGCSSLKVRNMVAFSESLMNLKKLDLKGSYGESLKIDVEIDWTNFKNLEVLKICSKFVDFGFIARLPNLKGLSICVHSEMKNISEFISHKAEQMEHLEIFGELDETTKQKLSQLHTIPTLSYTDSYSIGKTGFKGFL